MGYCHAIIGKFERPKNSKIGNQYCMKQEFRVNRILLLRKGTMIP